MSEIVLVVAIADNGVIGKQGAIPWHISEDMKRFKALTLGHTGTSGMVMVIGGQEIYERALPLATRIELTEVHKNFDGDTRFDLDRTGWHEAAREDHVTPDGLAYSYVTLTR